VARKQFAVIGLGRFGTAMAETLTALGHDVIGVDRDETIVQSVADVIAHPLQLDATDERALRAAGINEVDVAVVSIGDDIEASVLVVMQLRDLGIQNVVAKAVTPLHSRILEKVGASRVIFPEREMAIRIAHSLVLPSALDYVELSHDFSIIEIPAPPVFVGRSLKQLELRPKLGITLIAIKRVGSSGQVETNISPMPDEVIRGGDVLALIGSNDRLNGLDAALSKFE
jgi:trk system potassium uptake protein TrkA